MTILLWAVVILFSLFLLLFVLPVLWFRFADTTPKGVSIAIVAPNRVTESSSFEIAVKVSNSLEKSRALSSMDFDHSLLKAFSVESLEPAPYDKSSMLGTTAFHYKLVVPPRGSLTITLNCKAQTVGDFSGIIRLFVDSVSYRSQDTYFEIAVDQRAV